MILVVAATEMEAASFRTQLGDGGGRYELLISGVGLVETAARLGRYLAENHHRLERVVQFGIGGAYIHPDRGKAQPGLLAVCLAEKEILGDLGVELGGEVEYFSTDLVTTASFHLAPSLWGRAKSALLGAGITPLVGNFVTVNSASGTRQRGEFLRRRWNGLCENMEGAAAARVCAMYDIPMLEVRVISNMVEDRNLQNWQLGRACDKAGEVAALLVEEFV